MSLLTRARPYEEVAEELSGYLALFECDSPAAVAARLGQLREERGLSIGELAVLTHSTAEELRRIESGDWRQDDLRSFIGTVIVLGIVLHTTLGYLLRGAESRSATPANLVSLFFGGPKEGQIRQLQSNLLESIVAAKRNGSV